MRKYKVTITEISKRVVEYEANSKEEAIDLAKSDYEDEEIVLDYSDYQETTFK